MALEIRKKSLLVWKFIDTVNVKEFIPSRFSVNTLDNTVTVIYKDGANSQTYNLSEIQLYDLGSISPFPTFVTIEAFMLKLEQMNCPCFPEISVIGGVQSVVAGTNVTVDNTDPLNPVISASDEGGTSIWGGITGTLSDQTDLQTALGNKLDKVTTNDGIEKVYIKNPDGTQGIKPSSDFEDVSIDLQSVLDNGNTTSLNIELIYEGNKLGFIMYAGYVARNGIDSGGQPFMEFDDTLGTTGGVSTLALNNEVLNIESDYSLYKGIKSTRYFGANYDDNTYVQKKYVDDNFFPLAGIIESLRKMKLTALATGLKISSRSDGGETGVILQTDNLTADRTKTFRDANGQIADEEWVKGYAVTSSLIDFKRNSIYGTFTTPITANVTVDLTSANLGLVQKMYHQSGTAPTFPSGFVKINGTYSTSGKNLIYFEWSEGTRVEYWIINL